MRKLLVKNGRLIVAEVPGVAEPGDYEMRVGVLASALSPGTESAILMANESGGLKNYASKLSKAGQFYRDQGLMALLQKIQDHWSKAEPLGYSAAGLVLSCGAKVHGFAPGDLVASSGNQFAHHAEEILVSSALSARVPESVSVQEAATVTLGAIALNSVRQAQVSIGESVAVIGLGVLGQLIAQIAQAAGARVIGLDALEARLKFAQERQFIRWGTPAGEDSAKIILDLTGGLGVDKTIIAAHSPESDAPMKLAGLITRMRGRITVVGNIKTNIERTDLYQKDLSINIAVSYGPGRYDAAYETKGADYPPAYVPWTAQRNMACYLNLIAERKITVAPLIQAAYPLSQAQDAYAQLLSGEPRPLLTLIEYPKPALPINLQRSVHPPKPPSLKSEKRKINVGIVGAGEFLTTVHLPILKEQAGIWKISWIISKSPEKAAHWAKMHGARASSNFQEMLGDPSVDLVLIGTRHNLHAEITGEALRAGKAVFTEKPLATTLCDLEKLTATYRQHPQIFHIGFNRRFSPMALRLKKELHKLPKPWIMHYRIAAEILPPGHWVLTEEGGGRVIGELCHMIDLISFLFKPISPEDQTYEPLGIESRSVSPPEHHLTDHTVTTLTYPGGAIATLSYSATGSKGLGKEFLEIISPRGRIRMENFRALEVSLESRIILKETASEPSKGLSQEWSALSDYLLGKSPSPPISFDEAVSVTKQTILIDQLIRQSNQ